VLLFGKGRGGDQKHGLEPIKGGIMNKLWPIIKMPESEKYKPSLLSRILDKILDKIACI
jgi:hypothetical protein